MCVATWFAHKLAGHLLQRGRQFFVLRSSALRGGPNVFSFFGRPCTNSGTAFCRIVSAFSRHSAAGTCIDPDTVCVAVVSLWLSGDIDGSPERDRKSTRLNSSHQIISYAVFCLKKKNK